MNSYVNTIDISGAKTENNQLTESHKFAFINEMRVTV